MFGGSDKCKGVGEPMRHPQSFRQSRGWTQDADILFVGFKRSEDLITGLIRDPIADLRQAAQVCMEESWQVGKADCSRHIDADFFPRTSEFLGQVMQ